MKRTLEPHELIERSIIKKFRKTIWNPFTLAVRRYQLVQPGDKIAVCISGGKDSMLMAKLMQLLQRYSEVPFEVVFLVMDPGYNEINRSKIESNAALLHIPIIDMTRSKEDIDKILNKARKGKLNFLYVTPERLQSHSFIEAMQHLDIFMVVIDECHSITEWGYTFRDAYLHIGDFIGKLKHKPVICACSATISADSLNIIHDSLHMDKPAVLRSDLRRDNLILLKKDVTCNKKTLEEQLEFRIKKLCKTIDKYHKDGSVLIFAQTTTYVDALYNILGEIYPGDVTRYHSRIKPERRKKQLLFDFLQGKRKIMIATSAFSMGIDVSDIELVVHFNAPISMTDYIQQIGRAGRDGRKAHCVLFYDQNGDDEAISNSFIKKAKKQSPEAAKVIKAKLRQVHNFIHSDSCMVCDILEQQGQHETKTCKRCTVCAQKRRNSK